MSEGFDPVAIAAPGVAAIKPYQPGKPIEELEAELGITNAIKLASNENPRGPSPKVIKAIESILPEIPRYPDGGGIVLKRALAAKLAVAPEQITLGNGSNDILELVVRAFANEHNSVVFSEHAFAVYPLVTQAVGARSIVVPDKNWAHDLEAMVESITSDTRVVFVANPNNPTGTWIRKNELEKFLQAVPLYVVIVLDEAYFEYAMEADYPNGIEYLNAHPNLVVTRTFSKVYGLAGLRVGYGISSEAIGDLLNRIRQPFNVNSLAQAAALAALQDDVYVEQSKQLNHTELQCLYDEFEKMGLSYIKSSGNFVSVDFGRPANEIYDALLRQGVIVRPVANYGMSNHLRITVGIPEENDRLLNALRVCLENS